jgi:ribosomal protein S18 acetylase RimI-like enzyme
MSDLWPLRALPENPADLPVRLAQFDCGKPALNAFIQATAAFNQQTGVSRTTYLHPPDDPDTVAGYFSLALAVVDQQELPTRVRRRLIQQPFQAVPLLARLAVDRGFMRRGFGERLLIAALAELLQVCDRAGSPVIAVQPLDDEAVGFYRKYGFVQLEGAKHMFLRTSTARKLFALDAGAEGGN